MSFANLLKSIFIMSFGAYVGYSSVKFFSQPNESNRHLASITFSKLGVEHYAKTLFNIKIKNESIALLPDEVSVISVSLEAYKAIPTGLTYTWNLPENATLVEGDKSGTLPDFANNEQKEFIIKVKGYSKQVKDFISFTIKGNVEGKPMERDVLVSSRPEDSFEYVVQETERLNAIQTQTNKKLGKRDSKSRIDIKDVAF